MILVIGGAYQGKLDYVKETYGLTDEDVFTCEEGSTAVGFDEKVVDHFERYVLALIKAGQVPERAVGMQLRANRYKGRIIICDDISQGVVPMDATERAWREGVGRTMVRLAGQADKVVRVFCGIPEIVKDETTKEEPVKKTDGLEAVFASEANGAVKPRTPFGLPGANPFENYNFGEEGGLTPEEQFRANFEKMKKERAAAKAKAKAEQEAKEKKEE